MIKDKFNRSGKEQYRQLDTPKTEEKTTTVNTEGNKSEAPKKKKISSVYFMHRMPAMAVKEEENRQQARERDRHVHRTAVREAQEQTQETVSPVSRETVRVARIVLRAEDRRATVRKEEETAEIVLAETVPRMVRDVRQDRARETEAHVRMTEEAETVSAVEQTVAREVRAEALKEEETEETVLAVEQTVARVARADVRRRKRRRQPFQRSKPWWPGRRTASGTEKKRWLFRCCIHSGADQDIQGQQA